MMAGDGMIVSILQLMGFPIAKPVHSRAGETLQEKPLKAARGVPGVIEHKQAISARRDQVNAKSGKDPKSKAVTVKANTAGFSPAKGSGKK